MRVKDVFLSVLLNALLCLALIACDNGSAGEQGGDSDSGPIVCLTSNDCPSGLWCNPESGYCEEYSGQGGDESGCDSDYDCGDGYICDDGKCVSVDGDADDGSLDGDSVEADGDASADGDEQQDGDSEEDQVRCDDHLPCTDDSYDGSQCVFELKAGYCLIQSACFSENTLKGGNDCQACIPSQSTDAWSNLDDNSVCDDGNICTENDACQAGQCVATPVICADTVDCTEDECVENIGCVYNADDDNCEGSQVCDPVMGCSDGCQPDSVRCIEGEYQFCNSEGDWELLEQCEDDAPLCIIGKGCVECVPDSEYCQGNWWFKCGSDGMWDSQYCIGPNGSCGEGGCENCQTEGELVCSEDGSGDWAIYECSSGEWTIETDCEGVEWMCAEIGGVLQCTECVPNSYRCDGLSHQVCDENGIWQIDPCPGDKPFCQNGECVNCRVGDTRCGDVSQGQQENDLYECRKTASGNDWVFVESCPASAPNCTSGVCEACTPGETQCADDSHSVEICNDDGLWEHYQDCGEGVYCDPQTGECADGWSLYFDGQDKMLIEDLDRMYDPNAEFTIEAWILPTQLSGNCVNSGNTIAEKWDTWPHGAYLFAVCEDFPYDYAYLGENLKNDIRFFAMVGESSQHYLNAHGVINVGEWNHVAAVWADSRMDLYVNGARARHYSNSIGWMTPSSYQQDLLEIGCLGNLYNSYGFKGYIDEVRISKVARYEGTTYTPQMHFTNDALTTGLWHMDDFSDTDICIDSSGHHDGDNTYGATYSEYGVGEDVP